MYLNFCSDHVLEGLGLATCGLGPGLKILAVTTSAVGRDACHHMAITTVSAISQTTLQPHRQLCNLTDNSARRSAAFPQLQQTKAVFTQLPEETKNCSSCCSNICSKRKKLQKYLVKTGMILRQFLLMNHLLCTCDWMALTMSCMIYPTLQRQNLVCHLFTHSILLMWINAPLIPSILINSTNVII